MLNRFEALGIGWPLLPDITDAHLASRLYPAADSHPNDLEDPDWATLHMELRHLLREEYCQRLPVPAYSYYQPDNV